MKKLWNMQTSYDCVYACLATLMQLEEYTKDMLPKGLAEHYLDATEAGYGNDSGEQRDAFWDNANQFCYDRGFALLSFDWDKFGGLTEHRPVPVMLGGPVELVEDSGLEIGHCVVGFLRCFDKGGKRYTTFTTHHDPARKNTGRVKTLRKVDDVHFVVPTWSAS